MPEDNIKAVIEAFLFSSDRPLSPGQIKCALDGLGTDEIRRSIEELRAEYGQANRGIRIVEIAGGFQMITAPAFASFLRKLYKQRREEKLSQAALETLAIIAYKQPVTRLEIESLRNVNVDGIIRSFLEKGFIRISGRKKAPGRPRVYGTTRQFLEHFGLRSLDELPKIEEFLTKNSAEPLAPASKVEGAADESKEPAKES